MSNKLYSMLELSNKGFPHNEFYALDLKDIRIEEIESYLKDSLRNFKAKTNCRSMMIRTGYSGGEEVKLYLAPDLDPNDDGTIINKMKEALTSLSKRFNGYSNGFIILQEWTPEEDYLFSLNLMQLNNEYVIEAVKGNHVRLDREEKIKSIIKLKNNGVEVINNSLKTGELMRLNRHVKQLLNQHLFKNNCVYELSILKNRASFYQIKKPGELIKEPLSKDKFYKKLEQNNIKFNHRILKK